MVQKFRNLKTMSKTLTTIMILLLLVSISNTQIKFDSENPFPVLKGEFLGQPDPGKTAKPFANDIITKSLGISFTPDGKELYYTQWLSGDPRAVIMTMKMIDGVWLEPETTAFSGKYMDWDLNLSPDGKRLYFSSRRPVDGGDVRKDAEIWFVEKSSGGEWSKPQNIGSPISTTENEVYPSVSESGNMYFFSGYEGGIGSADIYVSKFVNGKYSKPECMGKEINTENAEMDPFIAPDESYLIFHSRADGGYGENDLYISFRFEDGSWAKAVNMGPEVNSKTSDYCGRVSNDGKFFFYTSSREGQKGFYWISAKIIDDLKQHYIKR